MNFKEHYGLEGKHAFLSASKYSWLNYSKEKVASSYKRFLAKELGTRYHAYACESIALGIKLPKNKKTLNSYINDAIGFQMKTEQILYYSDNCFGTADAISFKNNFLRIHDLKTGFSPTSFKQLEVYASLFCLEYKIDPLTIQMELRIYQTDEVSIYTPVPEHILHIMETIIEFDKIIYDIKQEVE